MAVAGDEAGQGHARVGVGARADQVPERRRRRLGCRAGSPGRARVRSRLTSPEHRRLAGAAWPVDADEYPGLAHAGRDRQQGPPGGSDRADLGVERADPLRRRK